MQPKFLEGPRRPGHCQKWIRVEPDRAQYIIDFPIAAGLIADALIALLLGLLEHERLRQVLLGNAELEEPVSRVSEGGQV